MKKYKSLFIYAIFATLYLVNYTAGATSRTWLGSKDTHWNDPQNWWPNGTPSQNDTVSIDSVTNHSTNNPVLDTNVTIKRLIMTSGTLNLNGDTLTITGNSIFNGGAINNGLVMPKGSTTTFAGTTFGAAIQSRCAKNELNGGTYSNVVSFEDTANSNVTSTGGCTFNAPVTIIKSGTGSGYKVHAGSAANTFNSTLAISNAGTREIQMSTAGTNNYYGNVTVTCTGTGGIYFGTAGGGLSKLDTGKTITVGSGGFTAGTLLLRDFLQKGSKAQFIRLTGAGVLNCISASFNGPTVLNAPALALKSSVFTDSATFVHTGGTRTNSDGGNVFNGVTLLTDSGAGYMRLAVTDSDSFNGNVTFRGLGGRIQIGWGSTAYFSGNITQTGDVSFANGIGITTLTGSNAQTLHSTDSLIRFQNLRINKAANDVTLTHDTRVDSVLNFYKGRIISSSGALMIIDTGATVTGASDSSFVSGPVKKKGKNAFVFPVGKDAVYRALEMSAPAVSSDAFTAEYFSGWQPIGNNMDSTLDYISECNYWQLARNGGSSTVTVTLYFDSTVCGISDSANLRIAQWNDTIWNNKGAGTYTGNSNCGKLATPGAAAAYTYFSLGTAFTVFTAPISFTLGMTHTLTEPFYGLNGASLIAGLNPPDANPGDRWSNISDLFENEPFSILRYPGGTVANYWGWEIGSLYSPKNMPAGVSMPNNFLRDRLEGDEMHHFKLSVDLLTCDVVFDFNIMTSNLHDQSGMLYNARILNLPVTSVELGNEFYLHHKDYVSIFPSATQYAKKSNDWAEAIKDLGNNYVPKIAIVGAWSKDIDHGRRRLWLERVLDALPANSAVDAVTIHQYIGNNINNLDKICQNANVQNINIERMISGAFQNMDELIAQELDRLDTDTKNPNLEAWITEFNMVDGANESPGTWAHALFNSARALAYLGHEKVSKVLLHDIVEDNISSPVYFSNASPDWNLTTCPLPTSTVAARQHTAAGNAYSMIAHAARDADKAIQLIAAGVKLLYKSPYKEIYGWKFVRYFPPVSSAVVAGTEVILMNMCGNSSYQFTPADVLGYTTGSITIESMTAFNYLPLKPAIEPRTYVTGDASSTSPNASGLALIVPASPVITGTYSLPPWSITRIVRTTGITLTPTVDTLCESSSTTIRIEGADPSTTYTWSVTSATSGAPTITMSNGSLSTFTAPTLGGLASATYNVDVKVGGVTKASTTLTVYKGFTVTASITGTPTCTGADLTGTVIGWTATGTNQLTYKWIPSHGLGTPAFGPTSTATVTNTTAAPDSTTDYVLYVSDDYCAARSTPTHVSILATPDIGQDLKICGSTVTIDLLNDNYGTGTTYEWSTMATTTTITVTGLSPGNYTYTLTVDSSTCSNLTTINVRRENCCPASYTPADNIIWPEYSSDPEDNYVTTMQYLQNHLDNYFANNDPPNDPCYYNGSNGQPDYYEPSGTCPNDIYINGKLRLNRSLEFRNCNIYFGEEAEIFSDPSGGNSRTLIFNKCTLKTCGTFMWDGLKITNDLHKIVVTNDCVVEDAELAVDMEDDAEFLIEKSTFNKNRNHIRIADTKNETEIVYPTGGNPNNIYTRENIIAGNTFDCDAALNTSPTSYTQKAIELVNVVGVKIGYENNTYTENIFQNCDFGIYSNKSSLAAIKNTFQDLGKLNAPVFFQGTGIYSVSAYDDNDRNVTIGTTINGVNYFNTFTDSKFGAVIVSETNAAVEHNQFNSDISTISLALSAMGTKTYTVNDNSFSGFNIGVAGTVLHPDATINIANNNFNTGVNTTGGNFYNTAVTVQSTIPISTDLKIFGNTITDPRIGIHARNIPGVSIGVDENGATDGNKFYFNLGASPTLTDYNEGIWLQNCNGAKVVCNEISNDQTATGTTMFKAIDVELSPDSRINCNTISNLPLAMNFTGNCDLTKLRYNNMTGYEHGVNLDPNAFLPGQGDDNGSGQFIPYDNQWDYAGTEPPSILKVSETNTPILWYYQGSTLNTNTYCPIPSSLNVIPAYTPLSGNNDCSDFSRYADRENSIGKAVYDSLQFNENPDENMYMAKEGAYHALKEDNLLANQGKPDDDVFYDFLSDMNGGNMALFDSVNTFMNDRTNIPAAESLNNSINDTNNVEYYRKAVYVIHIGYLINGVLTATDSSTLDNIAHLPLSLAGSAIYSAAAHLGLEIHQQFSSEERKASIKTEKEKPLTKNDVFMYPNPAFDKAYFYLAPLEQKKLVLIEIYDHAGNKIMMLPAQTAETFALDVRSFAAGIYSYKISCNEKEFTGSFIKSK